MLSAFAIDTELVLDIAEKSNEIPAAQALLAEPGMHAGARVRGTTGEPPIVRFERENGRRRCRPSRSQKLNKIATI